MAANRFDVVGLGSAIVDVLTTEDDSFLAEHGMTKGAMALIDEETAHRLYDALGPAREVSGGSIGNTIAGIAGLGGTPAFIGKVRDDQLGEIYAHDIRSVGVHFDNVPATAGPPTARCLIVVTPDAERTLNTYLGIAGQLGPDDIDEAIVSSAEIVLVEGYLWDVESAKEALVKAMDLAHAAGNRTALSLSDSFCVDRFRDEFKGLVDERVDVLFANEAEITSLYEVDDFDAALAEVRGRCELACLTRSEKGSVLVTADEVHEVPAHPVAQLVDTTGAGDLYAAGVLFGLTHGKDLPTAGRLGAIGAAEVISHVGARPEADLEVLAADLLA
jgi:sugar/nucleoside kinase (ribokinase family)